MIKELQVTRRLRNIAEPYETEVYDLSHHFTVVGDCLNLAKGFISRNLSVDFPGFRPRLRAFIFLVLILEINIGSVGKNSMTEYLYRSLIVR